MALHHMLRAAAGNSAGPSDPYFYDVTLLLTGDGTNGAQNNTFLDSSTNNFTITRNGNTTQGTFSPYGNLWSNYFDGSGDSLSFPTNSAFTLGTNDFTIEGWFYPNALVNTNAAFALESSAYPLTLWIHDAGSFRVYASTTGSGWQIDHPFTPIVGTYNHIVFQRNGNVFRTFLNGTVVGTTTASLTFGAQRSAGYIGRGDSSSQQWNGYISNMRIINGTAVYSTSGFTPPTSPLIAVSGTSLLTCQSNRFIDNSSNNFTLTVNGNTSVQRFSPFNPTAAYSTSTIGGSGYFDGTGDYLSSANTPANFGTNSFTAECWVWFNTNSIGYQPIMTNTGTGDYQGWVLITETSNTLTAYASDGSSWAYNITTSYVPSTNCWTHIAYVRNGSTLTLYANGVSVGSTSIGSNAIHSPSGAFYSGYYPYFPGGARSLNGYMSNVRLVNGSAVYTSAFTPPTAPLTAITNTSLLLNFTNAGIPDAAMMNDLETVGNAQVSTSVVKYGTGSLAFDGTGDYLSVPSTPNLALGSGAFTIEGWVYPTTLSGTKPIIECRSSASSTSGYAFLVNSSGYLNVYVNGFLGASSSALTANVWTHVALVRSGTGTNQTTYYINGTSAGTITMSGNFTDAISNITRVGGSTTAGEVWVGYIDDLRITKGLARYTANFTPPTAALPTY